MNEKMKTQRREILDGAAAIARGALDAGCNFYAGYPITPASGILAHMLRELPKKGGYGIQCEDEISSIGHCIGAASAGAVAFTATSGPGLSLYSESIGLATMMEMPLVIALSQRLGPSTGAATASAQGDIQFIRWCTSGGYPVIALSPTNIPECYHLTKRAFALAHRFRCPVFMVTDKDTVMTTESVAVEEMQNSPQWFEISTETVTQPLEPFQKNGNIHHHTGSSHNEKGHITKDPKIIANFNQHLKSKIEEHLEELALLQTDLQEGAETLILSHGISARSMQEAANSIRKRNERVSTMTVLSLWPVPEKQIKACLKGITRIIVPEMNHGQYRMELERFLSREIEIIGVNRVDTILITPDEIEEAYYA